MILDVRTYVENRYEELKEVVRQLPSKPKLVILRIGNDKASERYVRNKITRCEQVGIESEIIHLDEDVDLQNVLNIIETLNKNSNVTSVLLQLPLPCHLKKYEQMLTNAIEKDVDGFTIDNLGNLVQGTPKQIACTPKGIVNYLKHIGVDLKGKDVLIVNRSTIVGKPLALLMLQEDATVTIAHSKTKNLKDKCRQADIVITAIGRANSFFAEDFKDNAIVVDVSINVDENGKLCGDVCKSDYDKIHMVTPVPNGVGQMTVLSLIEQTIEMYFNR